MVSEAMCSKTISILTPPAQIVVSIVLELAAVAAAVVDEGMGLCDCHSVMVGGTRGSRGFDEVGGDVELV